MKKALLLLLLCAATTLISSCGSLFLDHTNKQLLVQPGMPQQELTQRCGMPSYRRFNPHFEEWEYVLARSEKMVVRMQVRLEGGRVVSMNTFEDYPYPPQPLAPETK